MDQLDKASCSGLGQCWGNEGTNGANTIRGGFGDDRIVGRAGKDLLFGGGGDDTLIGGTGADQFVFEFPFAGPRVLDFNPNDSIGLVREEFSELGGAINAPEFAYGGKATNDKQHLLYNPNNGILRYDADANGEGTAFVVARIGAGLSIDHTDFFIYDF